jgi:hypothetical protein
MQMEAKQVKTREEIRAKLEEYSKSLVLFPPGRMGGKRMTIRDQIKVLYWVLGELEDKDLG